MTGSGKGCSGSVAPPKKKTKVWYHHAFKKEWLEDEELKDWVQPDSQDKYTVLCRVCDCKLKNCNKWSLMAHKASKKHVMNLVKSSPQVTIHQHFNKTVSEKRAKAESVISCCMAEHMPFTQADRLESLELDPPQDQESQEQPEEELPKPLLVQSVQSPITSGKRPRKMREEDPTNHIPRLVAGCPQCNKTEDDSDITGKHIASKLRSLSRDQRIYAERLITEVLFEAQLGNLNRECKLTIVNSQTITIVNSQTIAQNPTSTDLPL